MDCDWSSHLSLQFITTAPRQVTVNYDGSFANQGAMGNITISGQESSIVYASNLSVFDLASGYVVYGISVLDDNLVIKSNSTCTTSVSKVIPLPSPTYDYITETYTCDGAVCHSPKSGDSGISNAYPGLTLGSFYQDKNGTIHKLISTTTGGSYLITYFNGSGTTCDNICNA
jgi:hypothetical protein